MPLYIARMKRAKYRSNIVEVSVALFPGRKHWFVQDAARFFQKRPCATLIEAFAGSAVVGLSLLYAGIIERLIVVEKDPAVVCLLNGMVSDPTLVERFESFECTAANVEHVLATETGAFRWLVVSRCSNRAKWFGGKRTDISCRWCPDVVIPNLQRVYAMRERITVLHADAFEVMANYRRDPSVGCFCDPPYTADPASKGKTLYRHWKVNHPRLFSTLAAWHGPWLMTQDNCITVRRLAISHRLRMKAITMNTSDNLIKHELKIWRDRPLF